MDKYLWGLRADGSLADKGKDCLLKLLSSFTKCK